MKKLKVPRNQIQQVAEKHKARREEVKLFDEERPYTGRILLVYRGRFILVMRGG